MAGPVPIVPAAVIFDRAVGEAAAPGPAEGRRALDAAMAAMTGVVAAARRVSAPARARPSAGSPARAVAGGLGAAALDLPGGARIAAVAVVNALGDVIGADGEIAGGGRHDGGDPGRHVRREPARRPGDDAGLP